MPSLREWAIARGLITPRGTGAPTPQRDRTDEPCLRLDDAGKAAAAERLSSGIVWHEVYERERRRCRFPR